MTFKTLLLATALIASPAGAAAANAPAQAAAGVQAAQTFSIPAGRLSDSLRALARQSGDQLLFDSATVAPYRAPALQGRMSVDEALDRLLAGTGLGHERTGRNVVLIRPVALGDMVDEPAIELDDVVVTGSLIRGVEGPSPVVVMSRDDIDRRGHASVAQALQALPQNFGGTANEGALQNGADTSQTNGSFASGVNLRGLGSDATLVLVNGRRMGGSGAKADFADVSTLPTSAVERIEILLDGASALYGSDAVGGVVNIILKTDYEGAETRLRVGSVTDGDASDWGFGQLLGRRWDGGGVLVSYEYHDREALPVSQRIRAGDADLRRFGGSDRRTTFSHPGNLLRYDAALGGYVPTHAIPSNQDGTGLTPADFLPGQVNLQNGREGMNVYGRQTRQTVYAALDQALGDRLRLSADLRYGVRTWDTVSLASQTVLTVDTRNPYFVSPTGATSHLIGYSFLEDIGAARVFGESENLGASIGADLRLGGDWRLNGYLAYAREIADARLTNQLHTGHLREALGTAADNPLSEFRTARDGFFNPFGDGSVNNAAVLAHISAGRTQSINESAVTSAHLQADGTVFRLPGGDARLAVGVNARREEQGEYNLAFTSGFAPSITQRPDARREVLAAFAETRIPLFGPGNRRTGLERLELSAAVRHERYDDIGGTTNPKLGLLWSPHADLVVRASYGTSFRAPALVELNENPINAASLLPRGAGSAITMIRYGGNPGLKPEEAVSTTAGFDYRSSAIPGLQFGLTWFQTRFDSRIGRPIFDNILNALNDPNLTPFIQFISPATRPADRALIESILALPETSVSGLFPVDGYGAIADARYVNTTALEVEGLDLTSRYAFDLGDHRLSISTAVSRLLRYETQATPASAVIDRLNTPNNPVGVRANTTLDWSRGPWGANLTLNHVGAYRDLADRAIRSWNTVDLQLRWEGAFVPLKGLTASLSVQNLFDADPPFYNAPQGIAYDAANANVLGRVVALQLTGRW